MKTYIKPKSPKRIETWIIKYCEKNNLEHQNFKVVSKGVEIEFCYSKKYDLRKGFTTINIAKAKYDNQNDIVFDGKRNFTIKLENTKPFECWYKWMKIIKA